MRWLNVALAVPLLFAFGICLPAHADDAICRLIENAPYTPFSTSDLKKTLPALISEIDSFEQHLQAGNADDAARWKKHLFWSRLQQNVHSLKAADQQTLAQVSRRFYMNKPGIEGKPFTDLRRKLDTYRDAVYLLQLESPAVHFAEHRARLHRLCQQYTVDHSITLANQIGHELDWMTKTRQLEKLRTKIGERYSHSNARFVFSSKLIRWVILGPQGKNGLVDQSDSSSSTVTANVGILRSPISFPVATETKTKGELDFQLKSNVKRAEFLLNFSGKLNCRSVSHVAAVELFSIAQGPIWLNKSLYVGRLGLEPGLSSVGSNLASQLQDVSGGRSGQRRRAQRRSTRDWVRIETQRVLNQAAQEHFRTTFDSEFASAQSGEDEFSSVFFGPLIREGALPSIHHSFSTSEYASISAKMSRRFQLAAPTPFPEEVRVGDYDMVVCLHQSFLNNATAVIFGGKTFSDEYLVNQTKMMSDEVPFELEIYSGKPRYKITYQKQEPMTFEFLPVNRVVVQIRIREVEIDGEHFHTPVSATFQYQLKQAKWGHLRLVREKGAKVEFDPRQFTRTATENDKMVLAFMKRKIDGLWQPVVDMNGIGATKTGPAGAIATMQVQEYRTLPGWVFVGAKLPAGMK